MELALMAVVVNGWGRLIRDRSLRAFRPLVRRLVGSRSGAAAVEFALIVPVVLAALTGIANYGLAMYNKMELVNAARAGAQLAILDRTDTSAIKDAVVASTNIGIATGDVTTDESYLCADGTPVSTSSDTCADNDPLQYYMTVSASQTYTFLLLGTTINLSGSVKVRTQ